MSTNGKTLNFRAAKIKGFTVFNRYHTYVCQSKGYIQCSLESVYIEILMYSLHWSSHVNQNSSRLQMNSKVNWRHWNILSLL